MKRLALSVLGFILIGFFLFRKRNEVIGITVLLTYMTAFSLLLSPVCSKLEKRGLRPAHAAGCAVVGLFLLVFVLFAAFIPYLITQSVYLFKRISPVAGELMQLIAQWKDGVGFVNASWADSGSMLGMTLSSVTGRLVRAGMSAAAQIGRIAFSLVLTYYVLCDRKRIGCHLLLFVPTPWRNPVLSALCACRNAMMSYLSGLLKTSAFVSAATGVGLVLLGVQDAALLALLMGVFEVLPYLGPVLASIPIVLSAMMQGMETALFALVLLVLVQQIEGSFVSPYFTASSTSVHPLAAILSVFAMGTLMGIWGILIAVPLLVLIQSVVWSVRHTQCMMRNRE
ncbi:MAG: AI-2E family transporter [Clostridia bacterium]|nr:AI-2E family transporter [Clostridia bacterium]